MRHMHGPYLRTIYPHLVQEAPGFHQTSVVAIMDPWTRIGRGAAVHTWKARPLRTMTGHVRINSCCPAWAWRGSYRLIKYEHEERMSRGSCAGTAPRVVEMLELQGRVRWYRGRAMPHQHRGQVRHRGQRYNEFDAGGQLEDVVVG